MDSVDLCYTQVVQKAETKRHKETQSTEAGTCCLLLWRPPLKHCPSHLAEVSFHTMTRSMFLKGCLCTVLETSGSLNAEITVDVFYASVVPSHKDFCKPELGRKRRWGGGQAYRRAAFTVLPISYKQFQNVRALVCALRGGVGASRGPNPEAAAACLT